jgi:hypothetical protein
VNLLSFLSPALSSSKRTGSLAAIIVALVATVACGMGSASSPGSVNGNTNVIVVASGTGE